MIETRTGLFGTYYGSPYNSSAALNTGEMEVNATYIRDYLMASGWTLNSICGMLGNMQVESSINPGRWQNDVVAPVDPTGVGYGLVQWTPYTNYTNWATSSGYSDPSVMDANLARIEYELANNLQWIPTIEYPMTFQQFKESTADADILAMIFLANYERPADPNQPIRGEYALNWYNYLGGIIGSSKKSKFKWVLYANKIRERNNNLRRL